MLSTSRSSSCRALKLGRTARGCDTSRRAREPSSATTDKMLPAPAGLRMTKWSAANGTGAAL